LEGMIVYDYPYARALLPRLGNFRGIRFAGYCTVALFIMTDVIRLDAFGRSDRTAPHAEPVPIGRTGRG